MEDSLSNLVDTARRLGAEYADARFQEFRSSLVVIENGQLKTFESDRLTGVGIRVLVKGAWGFASSSEISPSRLRAKVREVVKTAKATAKHTEPVKLAEAKARKEEIAVPFKTHPEEVDPARKVRIAQEANKAALISDQIKNSSTRLATNYDHRIFVSSEGASVKSSVVGAGLSQLSVAMSNGNMERVPEQRSRCGGFEFIEGEDWPKFTQEISQLALDASKAKTSPPGTYPAVMDPELVGLFLHEAMGHASEADLVVTHESVLEGNLGKKVATDLVTIYDDGRVQGGYFMPFDDEGTEKTKSVIVQNGTLRGYLLSREAAAQLGLEPTGNARAMNFQNRPIVRQTNFYMEPRDLSFDEMIEDIDFGFYVRGKGSLGGQVDVGGGTFTFGAGPSYLIENGKLKEMVRGVTLSGRILETLKTIDGVGEDLAVTTSVFGGCGKDGQLARVGEGGPHVRLRKLTIGGRTK